MKQYITVQQLKELPDMSREKIRDWWKPVLGDHFTWKPKYDRKYSENVYFEDEYDGQEYNSIDQYVGYGDKPYPLLSIGQMIEFLGTRIIHLENEAEWWGIEMIENKTVEPVPELCDALWEAVKAELLTNQK